MSFGPYQAQVVRIYDGDTCTLSLDLGFGIKYTINCRFYGINAPELSTAAGKASRDYLTQIMPVNSLVTVTSYGWDKYGGRFDGVIIFDGLNINQQMIAAGYAVEYA